MSFTSKELYEIGLNGDGIAGFEAQVASGRSKLEVLWPEHFVGKRVDDFCKGSRIAREWLMYRRSYATARRRVRARDFREDGATTCLRPQGSELREERLRCLREVARTWA